MNSLSVSSDSSLVTYADDVTLTETIFHHHSPNNPSKIHDSVNSYGLCINLNKSKQMISPEDALCNSTYPDITIKHELTISGAQHWNDWLFWKTRTRLLEALKLTTSQRLFVHDRIVLKQLLPRLSSFYLPQVCESFIFSVLFYACAFFAWLSDDIDYHHHHHHTSSHHHHTTIITITTHKVTLLDFSSARLQDLWLQSSTFHIFASPFL